MSTVVVVDDDPAVLAVFRGAFKDSDVTVMTAGTAAAGLAAVTRHRPDVVLLDVHLPDGSGLELFGRVRETDATVPVIFITAGGTSDTVIEAMKLGAFDYLTKPLNLPAVRGLLDRAFSIRRMMHVPVVIHEAEKPGNERSDLLVGRSPAMQVVYKAIGRVAPQDVTVLIRGESGTGKELVARALYQHSKRSAAPFLAINCAAIPEALLESELFGHEKGAFTGADRQRIGKFEQCSGGTLLLDEIGDMPPLLQTKMLRVLQEQRFERVGGSTTIATNVRIIAATHQDLERSIAEGRFRADLYHRLNVFTIGLPPLRERPEDIPHLIAHYLGRFGRELGRPVERVSPEALDALRRYAWPGNVRELQAALKQAVLRAVAPVLVADDLPAAIRNATVAPQSGPAASAGAVLDAASFIQERLAASSRNLHAEFLDVMERYLIAQVLRHTGGNQARAAGVLGIARNSLRKKIRNLSLTIDRVVACEDDDRIPDDEEEC
jgi:two-component system nitrogen regulation response regulator GlnG